MSTDPFARLQEAAERQAAEERAADQVQRALVKLILGNDAKSPFFATLALRLRLAADWDQPTAVTNGRQLRYNPGFVNQLTLPETIGVVAHEVMHNAGKHFARRNGREAERWQIACDLEINPILRAAVFALPMSGIVPGQGPYANLPPDQTAERYYELLPDQQGQDGEGGGEGKAGGQPNPDPGGCGGVEDAGDKAQQKQAAAEQDVAIAQAAESAKHRGALPAGLDRLVQSVVNPKVDWRDVLREYVSACARNDYTWTPPNRRFIHQGLYLPSVRSEELGDVVLAVDTSGSIGQAELDRFAAEAQGIFESYSCAVDIVYHDSRVQSVEHWEPTDGELRLNPMGGGGTNHRPVFEHVRQSGAEPTVLVCLGGRCRVPSWGRLVEVD
jgi:predicted metal-dependent peptidase